MQVLFDIPNFSCIMQLRAENQNLVSALSNYQQILYQFFDFTQNLKQSHCRPFWHFFDLKAYLIMTCMMSGGIGFRAAGLFPENFVAFFYSGLGIALASAGVLFTKNYLSYNQLVEKEQRSGNQYSSRFSDVV